MLTEPAPRVGFDLRIELGNVDVRQPVEAIQEADRGGMPRSPAHKRPGFAHYMVGGQNSSRFCPGQRTRLLVMAVASLLQREPEASVCELAGP